MSKRGISVGQMLTRAGLAVVAGVIGAGVVAGFMVWGGRGVKAQPIWQSMNPEYAGFYAELQQELQVVQAGKGTKYDENKVKQNLDFYFRGRANPVPAAALTPLPPWNAKTKGLADDALQDTFTFQRVTARVPRTTDGGLDWNWQGPNHDPEFAWALNRLEQLPPLYVAWKATGEKKYLAALCAQWRDWLEHNPRPRFYSFSSAWRALEAARRVQDSWLPILFDKGGWEAVCGQDIPWAMSEDGVRLDSAMLLASLKEHAECLRDTHAPSGNHLISEMVALATVALAFPEFKDAPQWRDDALAQARAEQAKQFYPDGAHMELANQYQWIVLGELQQLADLLTAAGRDGEAEELRPGLERGWDYFAGVMGPRGYGPLDNDSDIERNALAVQQVAAGYGRSDWLYMATGGKQGTEPEGAKSRYYPWAGQLVMRNGWKTHDQWGFFEAGPYGSDHQHDDRLQLNVSGEAREFLVDNGRYTYQPGKWRDYFSGATGHNVVLVDGLGPMRPPDVADAMAQTRHDLEPAWDFAEATAPYAGEWLTGRGPAYHTRAVLYAHAGYWIVADRMLTSGGPRRVEALWHFYPDCAVRAEGRLIYTDDAGKGNFAMLEVTAPAHGWDVELVRGQEQPAPQGWYSEYSNEKSAATCAVCSTVAAGPQTYVWVLWTEPAGRNVKAGQPVVKVEEDSPARLRMNLQWPDGKTDEATVPWVKAEAAGWERKR